MLLKKPLTMCQKPCWRKAEAEMEGYGVMKGSFMDNSNLGRSLNLSLTF